MRFPRHIVVLLGLAGLLGGCHTQRQTARTPTYTQTAETPEARYQRRSDYVDQHYRYYVDTGRAQNEQQAKALAGYQWDRTEQQQRLSNPSQITNATWSSDDARKRAQEAFEEDLAKTLKP